METNSLDSEVERKKVFPSFNLSVKIICLFLFMAYSHLQAAEATDSLNTKLYLNFRSTSLIDIIHEIEAKTKFKFFYSKEELNLTSKVDFSADGLTVQQALEKLLSDKHIDFKIIKEQILLSPKQYSVPSSKKEDKKSKSPKYQLSVSGKVSDVDGTPLPGASIMIKNTTIGVTTDFDGNYSINIDREDAVLVFSYIGFVTKELTVNGQSTIDVVLEESAQALGEVVVTALGIEREKKSLGYATSEVDSEDFTVNRTPNFMNSLGGKVAGVNISSLGTGPQGSSKIRIRGVSSFGNSNSPLIVVNGIPISNISYGVDSENDEVGSNRNSDGGDGLSSINPDDIESMTILKGAAASALYGSRAKDGVIMITTKNGENMDGGVEVTWNSIYTNGTPLDFTDYQYEYGQGEGGERPNSSFPTSGVWSFGEKVGGTQILFDGLVVPYEPQKNKIRDYYRNSSSLTNTISVASGGKNGGVNFSASNMDALAILPGSEYTRRTVNIGFTQKLKKLTISGNVNYSNEIRTNPPNVAEQDYSPVTIYTIATTMPLDLLKEYSSDENGDEISWSRFTNRTNPYFALKRFENNKRDRVYGNITVKFDLTDWLFVQGRIGQDYYMRDVEYNLPTGSQRQADPPPGFFNGEYVQDQRRFRELNADFLVNVNKNFGEIGTVINLGGNHMYNRSDINTILGQNFYTRDLYTIGNASTVSPNYRLLERKVNSLYGSAELSYGGFVYLNGTLRNDWFSTLSPENRSILYPSITGSLVLSQAFKNLPEWVTFAKVRAAYAQVGSDTDVAPYSNNLFYQVNPLQLANKPLGSINATTVPNSSLKPMSVTEKEIGVELKLFNNLVLEASYYHKLSSDQILSAQTSIASGYSTRLINVGESKNQGVEMLASMDIVRSEDFVWNSSVNASHNTSKVLSLGDSVDDDYITVGTAQFHGELRQVVGKPMSQLYGYGWLRDEEGNIVIDPDTGLRLRSEDQLEFGSAIPTWFGGFTNYFKYKNLSLSFLIDFKLGHKMISGTHINAYRHGLDKATLVGREQGFVIGEGVNPDGSVNTTPAEIQPYYEVIRSYRASEQSVFNAGSWQLRQVALGYDLTSYMERIKFIKGLKLFLTANNVAVLKKWVPHIHPDQNGSIGDNFAGLEATGLPVTREIGFNINMKF